MHSKVGAAWAACLLACGASGVEGFWAQPAPASLRPPLSPHSSAVRPPASRTAASIKVGLRMQQAVAPPSRSYSEVLGAIKSKVSPKWDDGASTIYESMEKLKAEGYLTRWNSATLKSRPVAQGELKRLLKTEKNLDEMLGLIGEVQDADLKKLTVVAFALSAVIGVGGSIIGGETGGAVYWVTYLGAGIPLALIGIGSVAPGIIGNTVEQIKWKMDPTNNKDRRIRHEAAHMICGYMCGLPLAGYDTEPTPVCEFFDRPDGNYDTGEVYKKKRPFSEQEVERLAVTALSGLMGELTVYEKADGGGGDLEQLQDVFFRADSDKLRKPQAREEMTRWGAYTSKNMLDDYKGVYEELIAAMVRGASVEECIATIESA
jgi:hypothetical protein